ncbi:MAG: carbamate kinase [Candidatus Bipolaricaulis sp.]|nr:carbamate kinase [Candidatus Bipolaricaulis sp.]MDD5647231.1 carbamate kinase [Candidatus Bipolaricaulis sp.]
MQVEKKVVVVALGGNAILQPGQRGTFEEQMKNVHTTCEQLAAMVESGKYKIVVTHGNGPQVGNILLQNEVGKEVAAPMPLYVCGAESQGLIGYMIQQNLTNLFAAKGRPDIPVATIVTQVVVDKADPAFANPTKPVGPFYSAEEAARLKKEKGYDVKEDAGRGWRRVVPSPDPVEIFEKVAIRQLVDARTIVIASGGGGIPVVRENGGLKGVDAVIDKDLAGERLAADVKASILMILTDVAQVKLHYRTPQEKSLARMTVAEAKTYAAEGHFAKGSMEPKVRAAIRFIESGGEKAIITSLDKATDALEGKAGTAITRD